MSSTETNDIPLLVHLSSHLGERKFISTPISTNETLNVPLLAPLSGRKEDVTTPVSSKKNNNIPHLTPLLNNSSQTKPLININIEESQKINDTKCSSCLITTNQNMRKSVTDTILAYQTIKDMITLLVPELGSKLMDSNVVCMVCFIMLESTVKFIKKCQETARTLLTQPKVVFEVSASEEDPLACGDQQYCQESVTLDSPEYVTVEEMSAIKFEDLKMEYNNLSSDCENNGENENKGGSTKESKLLVPNKVPCQKPRKYTKATDDTDNISCPTCNESFTKVKYETHIDVHPPYICKVCGKGFKKRESLKAHKDTHNDPNSYLCEVCGKTFKVYAALGYHMKSHMRTEWFKCHLCSKQYRRKRHLVLHIRHVHEKVNQVQCTKCGKLFKSPYNARLHMSIIHNKERPHECDICHMKFGRLDYLQKHLLRHRKGTVEEYRESDEEDGPKACKFCEKVFDDGTKLRLHLKSHPKRYVCKYCNVSFAIKHTLQKHEQLHEGGKITIFRCNACWMKFKTKEALDKHSLRHKNLKYHCTSCDKSFSKKFVLKHHNIVVHSGVLISEQHQTYVSTNPEASVSENVD